MGDGNLEEEGRFSLRYECLGYELRRAGESLRGIRRSRVRGARADHKGFVEEVAGMAF